MVIWFKSTILLVALYWTLLSFFLSFLAFFWLFNTLLLLFPLLAHSYKVYGFIFVVTIEIKKCTLELPRTSVTCTFIVFWDNAMIECLWSLIQKYFHFPIHNHGAVFSLYISSCIYLGTFFFCLRKSSRFSFSWIFR